MTEPSRVEVTSELYGAVEKMYRDKTKMRVVPKDRSPLMRFVATNILSRGDIIDPDVFLQRYSTTIYLPFRGPVAFVTWDSAKNGASSVTMSQRISTLAHEAQHVVQMGTTKRSRRAFATGYVMSPKYRCECEIEAYKLSIALAACRQVVGTTAYLAVPERGPLTVATSQEIARAEAAAAFYAEALKNYGLGEKLEAKAEAALKEAAKTPFLGLDTKAGGYLMELLREHV